MTNMKERDRQTRFAQKQWESSRIPFQPSVKGRKWNGQTKEAPSHCQPPRGGSQNVHAGYGVGAGRSSDLQARSMLSVEFPTDPRFPFYERTVPLWVFVPVYRCGAVPDLHRVLGVPAGTATSELRQYMV